MLAFQAAIPPCQKYVKKYKRGKNAPKGQHHLAQGSALGKGNKEHSALSLGPQGRFQSEAGKEGQHL